MSRRPTTLGLAALALLAAGLLANRARRWNEDLGLAHPPAARIAPLVLDPQTPRLSRRVVLVVIDGLGAGEAGLPYLDELRRRGVATTARVPYPTVSRPSYVTIVTGVAPRDSGVRANRVVAPVVVDTLMDRVRSAGLRVAAASDFGNLASLFVRNAPTVSSVDWVEHGTQIAPRPPVTWPIDEGHRVDSLSALAPVVTQLAARDFALVPVLVLDVDRAGHAGGVGAGYRAAAHAADAALRAAFADLDWARDTLIVTADHGHVAPGGHGGVEAEVSHVPLVLAGAGIRAGATARDARLTDVAPTAAALLGVPAPGHAAGRALTELLALSPAEAARRGAVDAIRAAAVGLAADVHADGPSPARLASALLLAGLAAWLVVRASPRMRLGALVGATAFAVLLIAIALLTRGTLSPSYVPSQTRTLQIGAGLAVLAIAAQLLVTRRVARRVDARVLAAVGLALSLAVITAVRAWLSPPFLDVPPPHWMVLVPALDLAGATCALACALTLAVFARYSIIPPDTSIR